MGRWTADVADVVIQLSICFLMLGLILVILWRLFRV